MPAQLRLARLEIAEHVAVRPAAWPGALRPSLVRERGFPQRRPPAAVGDNALQMRSLAYLGKHARGDGASPSADDLRQALRDRRRIADMYEEGSSERLGHLRLAQEVEAQLRARIGADLTAMKLAQR